MTTLGNKLDYRIVYILAFSLFLQSIDVSIVAIAVPKMSLYFHVSPIVLKLSITSYLLGLIVFMPMTAYLSTKLTSKNIFIAAMIIFLLGSICCGLSRSLMMLIASRVLQGVGAAFIVPISRFIILKLYKDRHFVHAINLYSAVGLCGLVLGPSIGGIIIYYLSWQWIFYINIPVVLFAIVMSYRFLPHLNKESARTFDYSGFILFGIANVLLVVLLNFTVEHLFSFITSLIILAIALIFMALYIFSAIIHHEPLLQLQVFRDRNFAIAVLGGIVFRLGAGGGGLIFIISLLLQIGFNKTAKETGIIMIVFGLGVIVSKLIFSRLTHYISFKWILIVSNIAACTMILLLAATVRFFPETLLIVMEILLIGIFVSIHFSGQNTMAFISLPDRYRGSGITLFSIFQNLGICLGVSVAALLLKLFSVNNIHYVISLQDFVLTLICCTLLSFMSIFLYIIL